MSSVMKGALNKMTIKQAFDEVNATDEQKKNGLDRLLQSDKKHSFIPQIKRYAAAAAAVVVAAGTAGVGIHFALINNQGGPINVSIGNNSTADSTITPSENTKVHSEKSGMTFVDNKTFWTQLGKITYHRIDNTPTIDTAQINAADDFDSLFCTDKQVQSEMLNLFDNAIDITNKYIVLTDSNAAVGISSDMNAQEIESFKNNSANYFVGTGYYENERFYYADKAYFGFDTSEEFINTVSQVYTGNYSDNFTEDFYDYCPNYIQPADRSNAKSKFGINIKELPITEPYSAHTQYCTAVYTDESHNSLILLSLTAKEGNNDSKTFELKYIPMKYVDGKLRIVVETYNRIFMDVYAFSDFMYNCGVASEIESDAKTVDITSVVSDSDNLSKPETTTVTTTVTTTTSATTAAASTAPKTESTTAPQTTAAPETTTAEPAPEPTGTATNVTLRMTGDESYLQRGYLYYLKVDNEFINNSDVLEYTSDKMSEYPMFNTDGSDHTFDSIECGTYIIAGPWICATSDSGYAVFRVTESNSNGIINIDLNNGTVAADKITVVSPSAMPDISEEQIALANEPIDYEGHTYIPVELVSYNVGHSLNLDALTANNYIKTVSKHEIKGSKAKRSVAERSAIMVDGKMITGDEINDYLLFVSIFKVEGESYFNLNTVMVRQDLVSTKKPKLILSDDYYNISLQSDYLPGNEDIDMILKDDNGKPVKNCEIYFVHLDDIDTYNLEHNNANVHASGDYCIANTDSEGRVSTFTGLYCGKNYLSVSNAVEKGYVFNNDRYYDIIPKDPVPKLIAEIPITNE